jgi:hypothetical protein
LNGLLSQKYNSVLLTDSDIIGGENLASFNSLTNGYPGQISVVLASHKCYTTVCEQLKRDGLSANVSYFE